MPIAPAAAEATDTPVASEAPAVSATPVATKPAAPKKAAKTKEKKAMPKAPAKKVAKAATKAPAKKAPAKTSSGPRVTFDATRLAVLKAIAKKPMTRSALKEVAPYSSYTALMGKLTEEGVLKEVAREGEPVRLVEITAKGRKALEK